MADLISRAAAVRALASSNGDYLDALDRFEKIPAVDAVPVVRCSECKYAHMTYDGECKYCDFWQEDGVDALYLDKGFYCAAGERRDGDT